MRRVSTTIVLGLCTLLCVSISSAQQTSTTAATTIASVPNLIRYSGTLRDAQGVALPSNVPVGFTFAVYDQQDGGAPIWQETQNVTTDSNGQYSVLLGSTTAAGLPSDLFSQQEQRWLGVQVQGDAEQPRVLTVSVPYAFKAHEAETLGGLPASAFLKAETTNVSGSGSMDGTVVNALSAAGNAGSTINASNLATRKSSAPILEVVNGPCSSASNPALGYIPMFTASNVICNSVIFQSGGSVGIGTTTPMTALDVNGDVNVSNRVNAASYLIDMSTVLSIPGTMNLFVGLGTIGGSAGSNNTYVGYFAGSQDTGSYNTISGAGAGLGPSTGSGNAYFGYLAGNNEGNGSNNAFFGFEAGLVDTNGGGNSFFGAGAGFANTIGSNNSFIGGGAGSRNTTGSSDVYLANAGPGSGTESNTIRIGTQGTQTAAFMAGIFPTSAPTGVFAVCVNASGQLFSIAAFTSCNPSSRRFKEQISDMGDSSSKLLQLHPVTYMYKPQYDEGSHLLQYGLIAEEVARVYPEMVAYEKDGQPYTVKYQLLAPMLLNEFQKEHLVVMAQQDELQTQLQQIKAQRQEIDGLKLQLQQQNASLQQRLTKLESYVATQTQMKTASDVQPVVTASPSGDSR
jgi:hypothetical protein